MTTAPATPPSNPQRAAESAVASDAASGPERGRRCLLAVQFVAWMLGLAVLTRVFYNAELVAVLRDETVLVPEARSGLSTTRSGLSWLIPPCLLVIAALWFSNRPRSKRGLGVFIAVSLTAFAIALLELIAAPLAPPLTSIFEPNASRGWALVPNARDEWMGVPVSINAQGMRGPVRAIPKPPGVKRVMFLGDSVTFGFQIEADRDTLPAYAESVLREQYGESKVETINAGVGGYSPWQEVRLFVEAGLAYEPDVVVVDFVLNDVSEKLGLLRFGGTGQGFQLEHSRAAQSLAWRSNLVRYLMHRRVRAEGGDQAFDRQSDVGALSVGDLLTRPNATDVVAAWNQTLPELARLIAHCRQRKIPILLVHFPYTIQLERPELDAPQRRLAGFAQEQGVELFDLTPSFRAALSAAGGDLDEFFIDALHLTPRGCEVAAEAIARKLVDGLYLAK